jgi:L-lactate dehydrogenase complex protein LldG
MATSRELILRSLRAAQPAVIGAPEVAGVGVRYADLRQQFANAVAEVGGRCVLVVEQANLEEELARLPEYASARRVASLIPGLGKANVDLTAVEDARELHDLDFCLLRGEVGVAESGAVWVRESDFGNRAGWFLAQHMGLVLPATSIVHDLHQAYERLSVGGPGFGIFVSGPSKTADIEQALVIGAQGPRSCTVFVMG